MKQILINFIIRFWKFWRKNFKIYTWGHITVQSKDYYNDQDGDEEDWSR
jgi:hypothetical protein